MDGISAPACITEDRFACCSLAVLLIRTQSQIRLSRTSSNAQNAQHLLKTGGDLFAPLLLLDRALMPSVVFELD